MKRSAALASLSRDHHQALVVAQQLQHATEGTAREARERFLAYWTADGRRHFRIEEETLLPAYAAYGDVRHPTVLAVLADHVTIRQCAKSLTACASPTPRALHDIGERLAAHVRREEQELFPLIEQAMPTAELTLLSEILERAEKEV